jgi:response regulator RpfG family c-di-GMP phosphodiesterase
MTLATVLFVDDDKHALAAYYRTLRKSYDVHVAASGEAALQALAESKDFEVLVSDMRMPSMDGIEFLEKARALAPDATRVMLTGASDRSTAIEAVNRGAIFRFLAKPCSAEELGAALDAAVRQHRLITAERDLLDKTFGGGIRVMTEILAVVDPQSFGRSDAARDLARMLSTAVGHPPDWELDVAAMLAPIGNVTIPPAVLVKARSGLVLTGAEQDMLQRTPLAGSLLLANIPRLEQVARVVHYQNKRWDGGGFPHDDVAGEQIPIASRLLRVAFDVVAAEDGGLPRRKAIGVLADKPGMYDPAIVAAAERMVPQPASMGAYEVDADGLREGMALAANANSSDGKILIGSGQRLTKALIERLRNFKRTQGIEEPLLIRLEGSG